MVVVIKTDKPTNQINSLLMYETSHKTANLSIKLILFQDGGGGVKKTQGSHLDGCNACLVLGKLEVVTIEALRAHELQQRHEEHWIVDGHGQLEQDERNETKRGSGGISSEPEILSAKRT